MPENKISSDEEDEAPYDRTYRDKSDMVVPEPRFSNNLAKYGNKARTETTQNSDESPWTNKLGRKGNKEESDEEEEDGGRNPYSQEQPRKNQKVKEIQKDEYKKENNDLSSDDPPPSFSVYERQRQKEKEIRSSSPAGAKKPNNPFLAKSEDIRSPQKYEEQSMDDVLAKMKNRKQISAYGSREGTYSV